MLIFLELPAKPRRTHLQNIGFLDKISLVQPVGKRTAHRLAVVNADSLFLVDVAPQVPVAPLLHVLHIIDFHVIFFCDGQEQLFRPGFIIFSF